MKLLFDFVPIILFFITIKVTDDFFLATGVIMAATLIQVVYIKIRYGRVEKMLLITLVAVIFFGGITLALHDEMFLKWKVSVVNWVFALIFIGSQFIGKKPVIQRMMGNNFILPQPMWTKLNMAWAGFFIFLGIVNLYVAYNYDSQTWVNFKLFGMLGLTLVFIVLQTLYISRHAIPIEDTSDDTETDNDKKPDEDQK